MQIPALDCTVLIKSFDMREVDKILESSRNLEVLPNIAYIRLASYIHITKLYGLNLHSFTQKSIQTTFWQLAVGDQI